MGVVALLLAASLSGCSLSPPPVPEPGELLCTWRADGGAELELGIYGALEYRGISWSSPSEGEGTWWLGDGVGFRSGDGYPIVTVIVGDARDVVSLTLLGSGADMSLVKRDRFDRLEGETYVKVCNEVCCEGT